MLRMMSVTTLRVTINGELQTSLLTSGSITCKPVPLTGVRNSQSIRKAGRDVPFVVSGLITVIQKPPLCFLRTRCTSELTTSGRKRLMC